MTLKESDTTRVCSIEEVVRNTLIECEIALLLDDGYSNGEILVLLLDDVLRTNPDFYRKQIHVCDLNKYGIVSKKTINQSGQFV
jgi:hypothetical protein